MVFSEMIKESWRDILWSSRLIALCSIYPEKAPPPHLINFSESGDIAQKIIKPVLGRPSPVLGMKMNEYEEEIKMNNLVIFEDKPINNHIDKKVSSRALH